MSQNSASPHELATNSRLPLFVDLRQKRVLVVGGGAVAASKLPALLAAGALVTLVAPQVLPEAAIEGIEIHRREFLPSDVDGVWFVLAAAPPMVNAQVAHAADERRVFVNAVDDPANGSAHFAATIRRGDFVLAISTGGTAPAIAKLVREALQEVLPSDLDSWMSLAKAERARWMRERVPMADRLPLLAASIIRLYDRR